ncbi:hypothetical protein [Nocardia harenae]|uniref:hypothetical protein n=1 Tax=Nocardia harenae TaxID=358707 RepID=UPI000A0157A4|nr:hypothetical protein [Nocardia harenae]
MGKEVAGKIFSTPEELGLPPLGEDELAEARRMLAQAQARRDSIPPEERTPAAPKFYDDAAGTEYERREPS